MKEPKITYKLTGLTAVMEEDLKNLVVKNMEWKMTSCLKKIDKSDSVESSVKITVSKTPNGYDGNFVFEYDGKKIEYRREWFKRLADLVNHAFDNFKKWTLAR